MDILVDNSVERKRMQGPDYAQVKKLLEAQESQLLLTVLASQGKVVWAMDVAESQQLSQSSQALSAVLATQDNLGGTNVYSDHDRVVRLVHYQADSGTPWSSWATPGYADPSEMDYLGELATALHRATGFDGPTSRGDDLAQEFADVLGWLTTLANQHGIDLEAALRRKYLDQGGAVHK